MRQTRSRQHDRKCRLKSTYFNHPSQGNSANFYLILGPQDKAAPPTSQQINKFPPKRAKNLATPSSISIFIFSSSTGELCSQPIRGNDRRIGRMFPEHVERSFLDPEYSFDEYFQLGLQRKVPVRISKDEASLDCYLSGRCERKTTTLWSAARHIPRLHICVAFSLWTD